MGKPNYKYVAKATTGKGWRIWNRKIKRWWGNYFSEYPRELLDELNGPHRTEKIIELSRRN